MKKTILFISIMSILFTPNYNMTYIKEAYANTSLELTSSEKEILNTYVNSIGEINKNIDLIAKNAIYVKESNKEDLRKYINSIDFIISEISTILKDVQNDYQANKKNMDIYNYLLAMSAILSNYKFALTQLKLHLKANDEDIRFKSLGLFYIIMNDSNVQLDDIKSELSK